MMGPTRYKEDLTTIYLCNDFDKFPKLWISIMVLIVSAEVLYWPMLIVFTSVDIIADKGMCIRYKLLADPGYYFI